MYSTFKIEIFTSRSPHSIAPHTHRQPTLSQHNAMPSPLNQDGNAEQLLTSANSEEEVLDSTAMMEEEGGGGGSKNHQRSSVANDDANFPHSNATNASHTSKNDTIDEMNATSDEEVSGDSGTKELEEESMDGRATTTRSKSTNEEDSILPSKELRTKSGNDSDDGTILGATANRHGVSAAVEGEYMGEKEGENHGVALGTGKSNESALQIVETGNDSNHHRRQYNQSFLSSSAQ